MILSLPVSSIVLLWSLLHFSLLSLFLFLLVLLSSVCCLLSVVYCLQSSIFCLRRRVVVFFAIFLECLKAALGTLQLVTLVL